MPLMHVNFYSKVLEQHSSMDVLLPTEYIGQDFPTNHLWPTLYLLHGLSDDHTVWQRWSSLELDLTGMPLAVVMPTTLRGFYTDMQFGPKYFTYISEELPALCEKMFHLSPAREDRFAAGLSMGGYGAFKLGLRRPDRYAAVASMSGALDVVGATDAAFDYDSILPEYPLIFGEREKAVGGQNDLFALAETRIKEKTAMPSFLQICGTEDKLYKENVRFRDRFQDKLPLTYREMPGEHVWTFWDAHISQVLQWLPLREKELPTSDELERGTIKT